MSYTEQFLQEAIEITKQLDKQSIESAIDLLAETRTRGGRLFILGIGGSAANASHAVNDFRKIVGIEAYAPTDNVSEITARTNDDGWHTIFSEWLKISKLNSNDTILVFSVGGGNLEKNISPNLVSALQYAQEKNCSIIGVVGKNDGYTAKTADICIMIPTVNSEHITPHTEAFQAIIWHLMVSHPTLKAKPTLWESVHE